GNVWSAAKYSSRASPIRIASYREARLILAEALAAQGDVQGAMTIINARRADLGLSQLTAGTPSETHAVAIAERGRGLGFEGAHRLNDLLRKHLPWKVGSNPLGSPYGTTTCWPYPTREVNGA